MLHKDSHNIQQQVRPTACMKFLHGSRKLYTKKQQIFDLIATQISLQHKIHGQQNKTMSLNKELSIATGYKEIDSNKIPVKGLRRNFMK